MTKRWYAELQYPGLASLIVGTSAKETADEAIAEFTIYFTDRIPPGFTITNARQYDDTGTGDAHAQNLRPNPVHYRQ